METPAVPAPITPGWSAPKFVTLPGYHDDSVAGVILAAPSTVCHYDQRVTVAHPQYPNQRHDLTVYEGITGEGVPVRFALGEVSNTAFVFSIPLT